MVLQIGQAAGALAALSLKLGCKVSEVPVRDLQDALLEAGVYIMPYNDLDNSDPRFGAVQRIGATGILRGDGKPIAWENQTWFRIDDPLRAEDLYLQDYYGENLGIDADEEGLVSVQNALDFISILTGRSVSPSDLASIGIVCNNPSRPVKRYEFCLLLDACADPFHAFPVDWNGDLVR